MKPQVSDRELFRILDSWSKNPAETKSKIRAVVNRKDYIDSGFLEGVMELDIQEDSKKNSIFMKELNELILRLKNLGSVVYDPNLVRGFDYYTDIVFEVFDTNQENNRSLFGGGRFDGLVGQFGVEPVPTVGFGMGDVTLQNFLESNALIPKDSRELKPATDLMLIGIDIENMELNKVADELRKSKMNIGVDYTSRKLDKKIKAAEKLGLEKVMLVRTENLKSNEFTIINLKTDQKQNISLK